jgi:hypothetical protein
MIRLLRKPFGLHGKVHEITPSSAGWRYVGFSLWRLRVGETVSEATGHRVLLLGDIKSHKDFAMLSHGPPSVHEARLGPPEQPSFLTARKGGPPAQPANMTSSGSCWNTHGRVEPLACARLTRNRQKIPPAPRQDTYPRTRGAPQARRCAMRRRAPRMAVGSLPRIGAIRSSFCASPTRAESRR